MQRPLITTKYLLAFSLITILLISCGKANNNGQPAEIDVSAQWQINSVGQLVLGLNDGQWKNKVFTTEEQNLFASLDTVNLSGTIKPDSVFETTPLSNNYTFPNPFTTYNQLQFRFTNDYSGQLVLKYVIVDSLMNPVNKAAVKFQAAVCLGCPLHPSSSLITITPNLPTGRFRLYYSLSSQSNQHFYKSWGNIQKTQ
jgi:hypothetical protein